jgi:4-amino-4-deoxy-L-arabinose transferase-like glycosyltransferase
MKTNIPVYIGLFFVLLIVRLPSVFFSVFDWDESTMILIGQHIINGNMPYIDAWDMKPPLVFYIYALFIFLFGKSLFAIRLGGFLCIYCAALFVYKTGNAIHNRNAGILSALFLVVFVSLGHSGLSTMPEHILIVPISFIIYLLVTQEITKKLAFVIGIILGMAILIKTNILFESIAVCIVVLSGCLNTSVTRTDRMKQCIVIIIGISIPLFLMVYYYVLHNAFNIFLKTNIATISAYIGFNETLLINKIDMFYLNIKKSIAINLFLWITFIAGMLYFVFYQKRKDKFILILMLIFLAQIISMFITGQSFGYHYLITSIPLMCLMSGLALSWWLKENKERKKIYSFTIVFIVAGLLFALPRHIMKFDREIVSRIVHKKPLVDDSCYRISRLLNDEDVRGQYIYMVNSCHIVNWLTESRYPTKYIHPSNLLEREYMLKIVDGPHATKEKELLDILSKNPVFIVFKKASWPEHLDRFKEILDTEIKGNYEKVQAIDTVYQVYKRKS